MSAKPTTDVPDDYATCGRAHISDAGEFTCSRGAEHGGQHWDSLAEFGWDD